MDSRRFLSRGPQTVQAEICAHWRSAAAYLRRTLARRSQQPQPCRLLHTKRVDDRGRTLDVQDLAALTHPPGQGSLLLAAPGETSWAGHLAEDAAQSAPHRFGKPCPSPVRHVPSDGQVAYSVIDARLPSWHCRRGRNISNRLPCGTTGALILTSTLTPSGAMRHHLTPSTSSCTIESLVPRMGRAMTRIRPHTILQIPAFC